MYIINVPCERCSTDLHNCRGIDGRDVAGQLRRVVPVELVRVSVSYLLPKGEAEDVQKVGLELRKR